MLKRAVVTSAVVLGAGLASFSTASAIGGLNTAPAGKERTVPATVAGMPPTSQVLFGVVNATGTLARGFGATAAVRDAVGTYRVTFRQNVTGCAFNGTIGLSGSAGVSAPGEIQVVGAAASVNQVFVTTKTSTGAAADRGFHLTVAC